MLENSITIFQKSVNTIPTVPLLSACSFGNHSKEFPEMQSIDSVALSRRSIEAANWREIATNNKPSDNLKFIILDVPLVDKKAITITGTLINYASRQEQIIVFPAGNLGLLGEITVSDSIKYNGPDLPPPAPPLPMELTIPANTQVQFSYPISLEYYDHKPDVTIAIAWSYNYWNEPSHAVYSMCSCNNIALVTFRNL